MYESKKRRKFWVTGQHQGALEHWLLERQQRLNGKCRHLILQISRQNLEARKNRFRLMFWISQTMYGFDPGLHALKEVHIEWGYAFMLGKI